jgi:hypothetical protein
VSTSRKQRPLPRETENGAYSDHPWSDYICSNKTILVLILNPELEALDTTDSLFTTEVDKTAREK